MAWEVEKLKRTLLIEKWSQDGKTFYAIYPLCRVTTDIGTTYMETMPFDMILGSKDAFRFNAVEFIDSPRVNRESTAGEMHSISVREEGVRR